MGWFVRSSRKKSVWSCFILHCIGCFPQCRLFFFLSFFLTTKSSPIYGNCVQKFNTMSRVWDWKGRPAFLEGEHKNFWTEETVVTFMDWVAEGKKRGFEVGLKMWASLWVELNYTNMEEEGGSDVEFLFLAVKVFVNVVWHECFSLSYWCTSRAGDAHSSAQLWVLPGFVIVGQMFILLWWKIFFMLWR